MTIESSQFSQSDVEIDGNHYHGCEFDRCRMMFSGRALPTFSSCTMRSCTWQFTGAAERTISWLTDLYSLDPELVEATFENIRGLGKQKRKPRPQA